MKRLFRNRAQWLSFALHLMILGLGLLLIRHSTQKTASVTLNEISLQGAKPQSAGHPQAPVQAEAPSLPSNSSNPLPSENSQSVQKGTNAGNVENGGNLAENLYLSDLQKRIQTQERYPVEARKRKVEGVVDVEFELGEHGELLQIHTKSRAKSALLENAAREAVESAAPFPTPPAGFTRKFRIPIDFKIK